MDASFTSSVSPEWLTTFWLAYLGVILVGGLVLYVYSALVLMTIANKTKVPNAWLAWIPVGNLYLMTQVANVPWWTLLVILIAWIPVVGSLALLGVYIWWWWKIAEARKKPGWWGLMAVLIPVVNLVFMGMIAWSE